MLVFAAAHAAGSWAARLHERLVLGTLPGLKPLGTLGRAVLASAPSRAGRLRVADVDFDDLDAPVLRVTSIDAPAIYSPPLEKEQIPNVGRVVEKVMQLG